MDEKENKTEEKNELIENKKKQEQVLAAIKEKPLRGIPKLLQICFEVRDYLRAEKDSDPNAAVHESVVSNHEYLEKIEKLISEKFSKIDKIEELINKVNQLEGNINKVNELEQLKEKINKIDEIVDKLNDIEEIKNKVDAVDISIDDMKISIGESIGDGLIEKINAKINENGNSDNVKILEDIEESLEGMQGVASAIEPYVEDINTNVSKSKERVEELYGIMKAAMEEPEKDVDKGGELNKSFDAVQEKLSEVSEAIEGVSSSIPNNLREKFDEVKNEIEKSLKGESVEIIIQW